MKPAPILRYTGDAQRPIRQGQPDPSRNVVHALDSSSYDEGDLQNPLRYGFTAHLTQHTKTRECWRDAGFLLALLVGVAAVIGALAG
jgi:hypothetical protein